MCRLIGVLTSDNSRITCLLYSLKNYLTIKDYDNVNGWGVGYLNNGNVLLHKTPNIEGQTLEYYKLLTGIVSDCIVAQARKATRGSFTYENTQPFRYQNWLFAHNGDLPEMDIIKDSIYEKIPDFLKRNIAGETDSELIFHLLLSFLMETGQAENPNIESKLIASKVQDCISYIKSLSEEHGIKEKPKLSMIITNGHSLISFCHNQKAYYTLDEGFKDCDLCNIKSTDSEYEPNVKSHRTVKSVTIAFELTKHSKRWFEIPKNHIITADRSLNIDIIPLKCSI